MSARRMHPGELDIDAGLVRRLVASQFPQWANLSIRPVLPPGTDNAIYRLGDEFAARLPRIKWAVAKVDLELEWLPRLAPLLPLPIPLPLGRGSPGEGYPWPWSVYRWLPGKNATQAPIDDLCREARQLAGFILALEQINAAEGPRPGPHNSFRGVPLARRDAQTRAAIETLGAWADRGAVTTAWDGALHAPAWDGLPVWIHGDLDSRNLLVQNGRLSAILDFGCLGVGDPACDVMVAWKLFAAESREVFRDALSVDEATWARARGWVLSQALIALAYYTSETNPVLVGEARHWIAEVLAD